jgi:hypothetical protein
VTPGAAAPRVKSRGTAATETPMAGSPDLDSNLSLRHSQPRPPRAQPAPTRPRRGEPRHRSAEPLQSDSRPWAYDGKCYWRAHRPPDRLPCRNLFAEMESIATQFRLLVEDGEIDHDVAAAGADLIRYRTIPSALEGKYIYATDHPEIRTILQTLFSDQSHLTYINEDFSALRLMVALTLKINDEFWLLDTVRRRRPERSLQGASGHRRTCDRSSPT